MLYHEILGTERFKEEPLAVIRDKPHRLGDITYGVPKLVYICHFDVMKD